MWWPSPRTMMGAPCSSSTDWRVKCIQRWSLAFCCSSASVCALRAFSIMVMVRSPGSPVVELLLQLQIDEGLGGLHAVDAADAVVEQFDEVVVVLAHDLGEDVEAAGREHDVVDGGDVAELLGDGAAVARHPDADHRLAVEAELHGIGHG